MDLDLSGTGGALTGRSEQIHMLDDLELSDDDPKVSWESLTSLCIWHSLVYLNFISIETKFQY